MKAYKGCDHAFNHANTKIVWHKQRQEPMRVELKCEICGKVVMLKKA